MYRQGLTYFSNADGFRNMNDGRTSGIQAYVSDRQSGDLTGKRFYFDLVSPAMVVGFRVYPCDRGDGYTYEFNHIVMSVSNSEDNTGNVCTELTEPATHESLTCYQCTEGKVIGQDLPTQVYYSYGRYVHFTLTQSASMDMLCIRELQVLSFR